MSKIPTKENSKKDKETIRELRSLVLKQTKEIKQLKAELQNIVKPIRPRKVKIDLPKSNKSEYDNWRDSFLAEFKTEVLKKPKV
jgi:hypothetical protein